MALRAGALERRLLSQDHVIAEGRLPGAGWLELSGKDGRNERGGHGFDLKPKGTTSDLWFDELIWWMQSRGLMARAKH